jgi:thiol-disulfide isomerase/thioredoxin
MRIAIYTSIALIALGLGMLTRLWLGEMPRVPTQVMIDPNLAFSGLDGRPHRLDEWRDKVLVVNFWATWCSPCLKEIPAFAKLQTELGERGLQFIGLAIDDTESVKRLLADMPIVYPLLIAEDGGIALAERWGNRLGVLPFTAVFDRAGRLVTVRQGVFDLDDLRKVVEPLLAPRE